MSMGIPADILSRAQISGQYEEETDNDYYAALSPLLSLGYTWCPESHKLKDRREKSLTFNTPWIHHRSAPWFDCNLDHNTIFAAFDIIPPRCMECWKTVVSPRNYDELRKLEKLQVEMDIPSKCGIEMRGYANKHYGGYFYASSLDEGYHVYDEVRKAINSEFDNQMPVILKRACTEFELKKGCSLFWTHKPEEANTCQLIYHYVDAGDRFFEQSKMQKDHVRSTWLIFAHSNGDMSYLPYNGDKLLFPKLFEYQNLDREKIKDDLSVGRAMAQGISQAHTTEFRRMAKEYAVSNNIDFRNVGQMLGYNHPNNLHVLPVDLRSQLEAIPAENKLGHADTMTETIEENK